MRAHLPALLILAAAFALVSATFAGDADDPDAELKTFTIAEGYEVNLFASEKDGVIKPIQCRFDARGRLWVVCSSVYPQVEPGQIPDDKILILEDTDNDGRADKTTVFAGGLTIPTGIELGDGGAYVGHGTELLHLKDTDGDGKADERRVVLNGFGIDDNHQNINSFVWTPGGELVMCQGLHAFSRVETPWGIERLDKAGVWRFNTRRLRLDGFFNNEMGPTNPWGVVFDDWGQPIVQCGASAGIFYMLPGMVRTAHHLKFKPIWYKGRKLCGNDIIGTKHFSDDDQGTLICGGYYENKLYRYKISDDGAGFTLKEQPPLIQSTSKSFRAVDTRMGPDGALYIVDWYNPIIGHYQASFRHPDRDKTHGRIWRLTAKGRPLVKQPALVEMSPAQLLQQLKSPERWTRYQAKRLLADAKFEAIAPALEALSATTDPKDEHVLFEALGVYETHERPNAALLKRLLGSNDHRARAYATRVIGRWQDRLENPLEMLKKMAADAHPRVRLEAVIACSYIASREAAEVALIAADSQMDTFLQYGLTQTIHALRAHWLTAFTEGKMDFGNSSRRMEFLITADGSTEALRPLLAQLKNEKLDAGTRELFFGILANAGGPAELAMLLEPATFAGNHTMHARLLAALSNTERTRKLRPAGNLSAKLSPLLQHADEALRAQSFRLAGTWKLEPLRDQTLKAAEDAAQPLPVRIAAIEALGSYGGDASITALERINTAADARIRPAAIEALAALDTKRAAVHGAAALADAQGGDPSALLSIFLRRNDGTLLLADALKEKKIHADTAKLGLRMMSAAGRLDPEITALLNQAAGIETAKELTPEELAALISDVKQNGDAARGEVIFRQPMQNCLSCHAVGGAGGRVGPDLSGIGTGMPMDYIINSLLFPNRDVKEGFMSVAVATKDGKMYQGYKLREDEREVLLKDVLTNEDVRIRKDNIRKQAERGSLMPPGVVTNLTRAELRDLVRFLSELGAPGAYAVSSAPVIRKWQVYRAPADWQTKTSEQRLAAAMAAPAAEWQVLYGRASGLLPIEEATLGGKHAWIAARFEIELLKPGAVMMKLDSPAGLSLWIDGKPHAAGEATLTLSAEKHTLLFTIDAAARGATGLRAEFADVPGSSALLQVRNNP